MFQQGRRGVSYQDCRCPQDFVVFAEEKGGGPARPRLFLIWFVIRFATQQSKEDTLD